LLELPDALAERGELRRAEEAVEEAASSDDAVSQVQWRATRAKLLARRGERLEAETLARQAVAIAASTDALNTRGDAAIAQAEVLMQSGSQAEAAATLREAVRSIARKATWSPPTPPRPRSNA
jgi:hypothetical protein